MVLLLAAKLCEIDCMSMAYEHDGQLEAHRYVTGIALVEMNGVGNTLHGPGNNGIKFYFAMSLDLGSSLILKG